MFTKMQVSQFSTILKYIIEKLIGHSIVSESALFLIIQNLSLKERTGIWKVIASKIDASPAEVHDYFFNTWQLQFYQDLNVYKQELKDLFYSQVSYSKDPKDAINKTINEFNQNYPNHNCNQRKIYQTLYRYAMMKSKPIKQDSSNTSASDSIQSYDNIAFQKALLKVQLID
ncbi:Conserved_hypothetical protein [Hexamita inflata]|uniref:Uncharacterized protein n=1 Tax=Hexamita inflata TaxID=28002 RepID=A0AA86N9L5_9EUKA|nr:Conserved hypothetical protein [Hexamita inflata]CAI9915637.1 Conserved hypothetical protein [Hexamita inflata]